jgi:ribose transport system ATP-binding protein
MSKPVLRVRQLAKSFDGNVALAPLDVDLYPSEFVALLGPNGAGKSTFIKVLDGVYAPDSGSIEVDGTDRSQAVVVVHQDLGLIDDLSVFDNLRLGRAAVRTSFGPLNRPAEKRKALEALSRFGLQLPLETRVRELDPSRRAMVAVARAASASARLVVLDEVTSVLSATESEKLVTMLREQSPPDVCFMMVTHKLEEALSLATRVLILKDGKVVCDQGVPLPDLAEVTRLLSPTVPEQARVSERQDFASDVMVEFQDATYQGVGPLAFAVRRGECVAITGRGGSDLPAVANLAMGVVRADGGRVIVNRGVRRAIVPAVRETESNLPELSVEWNLTVSSLRSFRRAGNVLDPRRIRRSAEQFSRQLHVVPGNVDAEQRTLSGGNQQKVIFGRALQSGAEVLVLCEPTRGVDVATRSQLYGLMKELKAQGRALLVLSSDPRDVLAIADTIMVLEDGRIASVMPASGITIEGLSRIV